MAGISVKIGANNDELDKAVRDSKTQLSQLKGEFKDGIATAAKYGAALAAAGAAMAVGLTVKGLAAVDAQAKLARALRGTIDGVRALQLAASDAGIDGMDESLNRLNRRLGAAEMGIGEYARSVDALGLNLKELQNADVDERIALIADAVRDSGLSSEQTARHVQNLGFEQAQANAFFRAGGDAIRAARQEVKDYGLALTGIEASQVEAANDAFARTSLQLEAVSQRLAVELAPILQAVSKLMTDAAKDGDDLGERVSSAFQGVVDAVGFTMDAVEGVRRVFQVAGRAIAAAVLLGQKHILTLTDTILNEPIAAVNKLIEAFNKLPGMDIEPVQMTDIGQGIRNKLREVTGALEEAKADMNDIIMAPLPSVGFDAFVAKAREDAQEAAEAMQDVSNLLRPDIGTGGGEDGEEDSDLRKQLEQRLEAIREANMTELELLHNKFAQENEVINQALENKMITEEQWNQLMRDQKARHEEELTEIEQRAADAREAIAEAEARNKQQIMSSALSGLTTLMNSESREMFEIGKTAAIAQSIVSTFQGMTKALELGWPVGPFAAAAIGLAGFANIQSIRSQSFSRGGGGGGAASNTAQINANNTPTTAQGQQGQREEGGRNLFIQGVDPNSLFTGRQLVELINEAQQDGAQLRLGTA